ncbi:hypothetical protein Tco_1424489, partial [Tanacetum coccineum]
MSGTIPPIPPPFGTSSGNPGSPNVNRVDTMPTTIDPINTTTTTNVSQSVVDENLPQLLDSRGGSHVTNVPAFDKEDFTSWKVRFLVFLDGLEDGPFVPMSSLSTSEILCLNVKINGQMLRACKTTKEMWNDLILAHEVPSDTRDAKIAALRLKFNAFKSHEGEKVNRTFTRLKCLLNDLENNGVTIPQEEVNATFVNSLPRKWLSMNQTQRANNSIKNDCLATLYGKYNYKEGLIDQIFESETQRFTIQPSSSKALISNNHFQDSDSDVKEDQRTSNEFMADLNAEYHERALLANQKRFYKRSGRVGSARKPLDKSKETCFACGKLDDEGSIKIRAFMEIAEDEPSVGKADARSGQWVDITMKKVHRLLSMTDGDERKHVLDYTYVDLHYVEDQRKNLVNKFNLLKQEISLHKSELSNLKNTVSINCSFQNKVIRVNLENESLKDEIIKLKKVIEKWTCSKVTLDQLLSEQVLGNIVKALGGKGRRKEKISSKEVVFTKADESSSVLTPEITSDSESECDSQEPLPKLIGAPPSGTSESLISLSELTLNMANLTLDTP